MQAFLQGLTRPSALAVVVAAAVCAALLLLLPLLITEELTVRYGVRYLLQTRMDADVHATVEGLRLRHAAPAAGPMIAVAGGSNVAAAVQKRPVLAAVAAQYHAPVRYFELATGNQTLLETLLFADQTPEGASGVFVIGVSAALLGREPDSFGFHAARGHIGLRSDLVDGILASRGRPQPALSGRYAWDNHDFLLPRLDALLRNLLRRRPLEFRGFDWAGRPRASADSMREQKVAVDEIMDGFQRNHAANLVLLDRIVERIRARTRMQVIVVEAPHSGEYPLQPAIVNRYRELKEGFRRSGQYRYVDLAAVAQLQPEDFFDYGHLRSAEKIRRCSSEVGGLIGRALAAATPAAAPSAAP